MASVGAIVAVATGIGAGVAAERSGIATPAGTIGRTAGADISGGAVAEAARAGTDLPDVPAIPEAREAIDRTIGVRRRRRGAVGTAQRRTSGSLLSGVLENTLLGD